MPHRGHFILHSAFVCVSDVRLCCGPALCCKRLFPDPTPHAFYFYTTNMVIVLNTCRMPGYSGDCSCRVVNDPRECRKKPTPMFNEPECQQNHNVAGEKRTAAHSLYLSHSALANNGRIGFARFTHICAGSPAYLLTLCALIDMCVCVCVFT